MELTKQQEAELLRTYLDCWESNLSADMARFSDFLTDDFSIFGSANGEVFHGKENALSFYSETAAELSGKAELRNRDIRFQPIDPKNAIALEESDLYVIAESEWIFYGHARICCVWTHTANGWKAVHQHVSFADHRTEDGQQLAAEQIALENLELREAVNRRTVELGAKNRELEIEAALERVRSRTMAMQHSDELAEVSFMLDSQVRVLGIATRGCAFNIYGENEGTEWFSSEMGSLPPYKTPRENLFLRYFNAGQSGKAIYVEEFQGETCRTHYEYLCTIPIMGDALRAMIENGGSFPERQIDHVVYFKYGYLLFITLDQVPETHDIFIRFARVFEQTYTRFLDLQKAEAQTHQAELDLIEIKEARARAEVALAELQVTQRQLIQSEKMASLGELTAGIAHEIQNPLNFVNNFSDVSNELVDEIFDERRKTNDERDEMLVDEILSDIKQNLEKINHHGKRADAIVKGMLQHSRSSSDQKEMTDINKLSDEYLRLAYHGIRAKDSNFNATLVTDFDDSIGQISIVPQDIGRVILNLITNAFYAVGEKKKSDLNFDPIVSVRTKKVGNQIEISISDNGNGIPSDIKDKIFQPFFTTKPTGEGTGLGLSLAYDIVKAHSGELKVNSTQNEGSEFIISLSS